MIDYTGRVIGRLRDAAAAWPSPFTDYTVRGAELEDFDVPTNAKAPQAIIVRRQAPVRRRRHPLASFTFTISCYHPDPRQAAVLAALVSDVFHDAGPVVTAIAGGGRIGAYNSADIGGSGTLVEPDTNWPREDVLIEVIAPTVALA